MSLPDRPDEAFLGTAGFEVTTIPYSGPGEQAHVSMVANSADGDETASMQLYIPLDVLQMALEGRVATIPAGDPGIQTSTSYTGATADGRTPGENVQSFTLALDGTTMTLTATVPSGTITAQGQFGVACTGTDASGGNVTDRDWESEFCVRMRETLGLAPWIAASSALL